MKNVAISIGDILRHGSVGGLSLGDSFQRMEELWGPTVHVSRTEDDCAYRYGDVEVRIANDRVWFIALNFRRRSWSSEPLTFNEEIWTFETTRDAVAEALSRVGMAVHVKKNLTFGEQVVWQCDASNAQVCFLDDRLTRIVVCAS